MLGLLIKDFYNLKKQLLWYIVIIIIFNILSLNINNIAFSATIGVLVAVSVPLSAIAYEEKDGWQKFAIASGISTESITGEKYLLGIICAVVCDIFYLFVLIFLNTEHILEEFFIPVCIQIISLSTLLPLIFKFGAEKGRVLMIFALILLLSIFVFLMNYLDSIIFTIGILFIILLIIYSLSVFIISFIVSIKFFNNKKH